MYHHRRLLDDELKRIEKKRTDARNLFHFEMNIFKSQPTVALQYNRLLVLLWEFQYEFLPKSHIGDLFTTSVNNIFAYINGLRESFFQKHGVSHIITNDWLNVIAEEDPIMYAQIKAYINVSMEPFVNRYIGYCMYSCVEESEIIDKIENLIFIPRELCCIVFTYITE